MSATPLAALTNPASAAVIGASNRPRSLGRFVMENLLGSAFQGPVMPVNPNYRAVSRVLCYPSVADLPIAPELALICTPPRQTAEVLRALAGMGCRAAVVMTVDPGPFGPRGESGFREAILKAAAGSAMRLLGPGSAGIQLPGIGLNASWISAFPRPGNLALITQSGSLAAGLVDWAAPKGLGFSHIISAGDTVDVDMADILDEMAASPLVQAVLLNIRWLGASRKFLSAARAISRHKPVIAVKSRNPRILKTDPQSQGGWLDLSDGEYDAAFRRAGILRVATIDELFGAAETLAFRRPLHGERLAIVCNGRGPAELAADTLLAHGGQLAELRPETLERLGEICPHPPKSGDMPMDFGRDGRPERFARVIQVLLKAPEVHGVLIIHTPTAIAPALETAQALAQAVRGASKNVMACWFGEEEREATTQVFTEAGVSTYDTPDRAARAFLHLVAYNQGRDLLLQPLPVTSPTEPDQRLAAAQIIYTALAAGPCRLDPARSAEALACYGISSYRIQMAADPAAALLAAEDIGYPVTLGVRYPGAFSRDPFEIFRHALEDAAAVEDAARALLEQARSQRPGEPFPGFIVRESVAFFDAAEFMAGVSRDALFGSAIRFGPGGTGLHMGRDHAIALPPLTMNLADELISQTSLGRLLKTPGGQAIIDVEAVKRFLVDLSEFVIDFPEVRFLEINPLRISRTGCAAVETRMVLEPVGYPLAQEHLAIRPYPRELEEEVASRDGRLQMLLRPIRPEDQTQYRELLNATAKEDLFLRFCQDIHEPSPEMLAQVAHIDYDREMAIAAIRVDAITGEQEMLGLAKLDVMTNQAEAEVSILVRTDCKGLGLGRILMEKMVRYCRDRGIKEMFGFSLFQNKAFQGLMKNMGAANRPWPDVEMMESRMAIPSASGPATGSVASPGVE